MSKLTDLLKDKHPDLETICTTWDYGVSCMSVLSGRRREVLELAVDKSKPTVKPWILFTDIGGNLTSQDDFNLVVDAAHSLNSDLNEVQLGYIFDPSSKERGWANIEVFVNNPSTDLHRFVPLLTSAVQELSRDYDDCDMCEYVDTSFIENTLDSIVKQCIMRCGAEEVSGLVHATGTLREWLRTTVTEIIRDSARLANGCATTARAIHRMCDNTKEATFVAIETKTLPFSPTYDVVRAFLDAVQDAEPQPDATMNARGAGKEALTGIWREIYNRGLAIRTNLYTVERSYFTRHELPPHLWDLNQIEQALEYEDTEYTEDVKLDILSATTVVLNPHQLAGVYDYIFENTNPGDTE